MPLEDVVARRPVASDAAGRCGCKKVCCARCRWKMRSKEGLLRQMPLEDAVARRTVASDGAKVTASRRKNYLQQQQMSFSFLVTFHILLKVIKLFHTMNCYTLNCMWNSAKVNCISCMNVVQHGNYLNVIQHCDHLNVIQNGNHLNVIQHCDHLNVIQNGNRSNVIQHCDHLTVIKNGNHSNVIQHCDHLTVIKNGNHLNVVQHGDYLSRIRTHNQEPFGQFRPF